jgi:holo-[acyl-carrier protein] synthase
MIIAIGTDIIEVERIRRAIDDPRTGKRFLQRVYTEGEIAYCLKRRRSAESFAARFAAKEAVMKVLGRGFGGGITRWHLSLTHTATEAMAYVIAEAD